MQWSRKRKGGPAPQLVAAMASSLVLVVGLAVVAYFVEVRGIGLHAEMAGPRALELQVLCAALVGVAVLTQICVARVVAASRPGRGVDRRWLQRALDADYADAEIVTQFEPVPELRELVVMLQGEKSQVRELGDRLEILRGEIDGLVDGMQRSSEDLGPLREEGSSPVSQNVVRYWNGLVLRVREAEEAVEQAAERVVAPAEPEPEAVPAPGGVATLVARLDELEAELELLRGAVKPEAKTADTLRIERSSSGFTPVGEARPLLGAATPTPDGPVSDPWRVRSSATTPVGEDADWGAVTPVEPTQRATWKASTSAFAPGPEALFGDETAEASSPLFRESPQDDPFAANAAAGQSRTDIRAPRGADFRALDLRQDSVSVPPNAGAPVGGAEETFTSPSFDDIAFPHFVGKPVKPMPDRVEVTYDAQSQEEVVDLPASALLFEAEPETAEQSDEEEVLDLRSFGALEFDR